MSGLRVTVVVRDRDRLDRVVGLSEWEALTMVAAVTSDPRSWNEFQWAWNRYHEAASLDRFRWQSEGDATPGEPWILIDLANRQLVYSREELGPSEGPGEYVDDPEDLSPDNPSVACYLPPAWRQTWLDEAQGNRLAEFLTPLSGAPEEPLDFRGVLFGRAMTDMFAKNLLEKQRHGQLPNAFFCWTDCYADGLSEAERRRRTGLSNQWHEIAKDLHAAWLMTERDELAGQMPRQFLHAGREWVDLDVASRQRQWALMKKPPLGLAKESFTYRYGPFGLSQVVVYFHYCRAVVQEGCRLIAEQPMATVDALSDQMFAFGKQWLHTISTVVDSTRTPLEVMELDRRHLPLPASSDSADCDCPICELMNETSDESPAFALASRYELEMEDEFAFSTWESRDRWESERCDWEDSHSPGGPNEARGGPQQGGGVSNWA